MSSRPERLLARTPARLRPVVDLSIRTVRGADEDRVPGLAAEIAFFVLLSLPPLLLTVVASLGFVGDRFGATWRGDLTVFIRDSASVVLRPDTIETTIDPLLEALLTGGSGSAAGIGFVLAVYSASRALRVVSTAIAIAYDRDVARPNWQQRVWGLVLTLGAILVGLVVMPLLLAGPGFGAQISDWAGGIPGLAEIWRVTYWPAAVVTATAIIAALYHLAAPWRTPYQRDLPGAALAMLLWLAGSAGLRVYVGQTISGDTIYQSIAGPLVVLLWLYVAGFAVLLGAELNAAIEAKWPTRRPRRLTRYR
jgi:membrane protein